MEPGTTTKLFNALKDFATISLEELNATMSLMERVEKKYLISFDDIESLMKEFHKDYYILSIKWNSMFTYDNVYMDTDDFIFYNQHSSKTPSRMKVRTREYVDSDIAFFECKERNWKVIRKSRYAIPVKTSKQITNENKAFFKGICSSLDLSYANADLHPTIRTNYKRITLCSKVSDERITIDFDIQVQDVTKEDSQIEYFGPVAIIETKSSRENTMWRKIIKNLWYKEAHGCSKYCVWVIYAGYAKDSKPFKTTLAFIKKANKNKTNIQKDITNKLKLIKEDIIENVEQEEMK